MVFKVMRMVYGIATVLRTPADIYHASEITALPACYLAARLRRKPLVFETHEYPLVQPHITRRWLLHALSVRLLRAMMPGCAGVIVVSPPIATHMQRQFGGPLATTVRNIPPYSAPRSSNRLRERLGLSASTRIALYQGGIQENRSLEVLIRAATYLSPDVVVVMMGDGPLTGALQDMIVSEGMSDRVKMIPAVPYRELISWTTSADLGLLVLRPDFSTSIKYCLPNKLFEYLMAGVPVLASSLDAVADILHTYDVGAVVPSVEPQHVGEAIGAMLTDQVALARMRKNALLAAQQDLRWETERDRLVEMYRGLANTHV
jgi:glycosyltransferase involved in cell wall biosynthesis